MRRQRDKPAFPWKDALDLLNIIKRGCRLTGHALRFLILDLVFSAISELLIATFGNPIFWVFS